MAKLNRRARHGARCLALQALYQWQLTQDDWETLRAQYLSSEEAKKADLEYFEQLVQNICQQVAVLDSHIQTHSSRLAPEIGAIELSVLRIGIYELIYCLDVPYRVVINEGIELSKKFGAVESHKYINSILDKVAIDTRALEMSDS